MQNFTQKIRYDYLDIAKGIGILMVIWGHVLYYHWSGQYVYTFHMPLFFFLSGMLFQRNKYPSFSSFFVKRARRLLIPYSIYSICTWFIWVFFQYKTNNLPDNWLSSLFQTLWAQGSGEFMPHNSPLWFIPCLFAVEILYFYTSSFSDRVNVCLCLLLALASICLERVFGETYLLLLPWNFDAALMAIPFYAAGNLLLKHISHQSIVDRIKKFWIAAISFVICSSVIIYYSLEMYGSISLGHSYYGNEIIFHTRAFMGCLSVLITAVILDVLKKYLGKLFSLLIDVFIWFGRMSLDVMCTHVPIKGIAVLAVAILFHVTSKEVTHSFYLSIIVYSSVVLVDAFVVWMIDKAKIRYNSNYGKF